MSSIKIYVVVENRIEHDDNMNFWLEQDEVEYFISEEEANKRIKILLKKRYCEYRDYVNANQLSLLKENRIMFNLPEEEHDDFEDSEIFFIKESFLQCSKEQLLNVIKDKF